MKPAIIVWSVLVPAALLVFAAEPYRKPPQAVLDVLNAPATPTLSLSPSHTFALESRPMRYPPIAELSQPMLRLAGLRINPKTNGLHNAAFNSSLALRQILSGREIRIELPPDPKLSAGHWSHDGARFAFTNTTGSGIELWIGETATGKTHRVAGARLNGVMAGRGGAGGGRGAAFGDFGPSDVQWMPDNQSLLVELVSPARGAPPVESSVPTGPHIQESLGGAAPVATHEDMIQSPHEEDLFEYYATSQLAFVDAATGKMTLTGKPAIIESVRISPDARHLLVTTIHRPFSYLYQASDFPKEIEIWDNGGKVLHKLASLPLGGA